MRVGLLVQVSFRSISGQLAAGSANTAANTLDLEISPSIERPKAWLSRALPASVPLDAGSDAMVAISFERLQGAMEDQLANLPSARWGERQPTAWKPLAPASDDELQNADMVAIIGRAELRAVRVGGDQSLRRQM
jgi:hypothetical protein